MKKLAILFGGHSSEYSVSLESAYSVLSHINKEKYDLYMIGITKEGKWYHFDRDIEQIRDDTWWQNPLHSVTISPEPTQHAFIEMKKDHFIYVYVDAVFPILHGQNGEDGTIQALVQLSGIPLIGCSLMSSALCMDKYRAHAIVSQMGIKTPKALVLTSSSDLNTFKQEIQKLHYPLFVKPMKAGSSLGISKITDFSELKPAISLAYQYDNEIIIEEAISGFEVGCAIMGTDQLIVGRVDEIELSQGFFDFTEKYSLKTSQIHMPARIDSNIEKQIQNTAKIIYQALGCQIFARVDMFLTPKNEIVFNEVNTIPGFTSHSRFPNMMKGIGLSFTEILDTIIEMGLAHENHRFTSN
ncbi:D-alanine--D-serine ligase VanG [Candidatus Stoquefichus sp. SB1]|uniref:D-alanine--D-serine ligase VanG n=1 Tax=Candidatus Stoquefichus sp. SB1 TaxID=1658109 RepID=UPI000A541C54|nr:D-alanine--D-serine ligase VanG [Candidatus Stoquefichus sp. SB1]